MRRVGRLLLLTGSVTAIGFATLTGQTGPAGASRAATTKPYTTWRSYAGGQHSSQYSALDQINKGNVAKLEVAWSFPITGNSIFNPVVVDGVMYATTGGGNLAAIDAATGKEIWTRNVGGMGARGVNYWESADRMDRRLVFLSGGALTQVNAQTGEPITTFGTNGKVDLRDAQDRRAGGSLQTSNPGRIFENLYIIPLPAGGASYNSTPADVHAYDIRTGKLAWVFHTIPGPDEFGIETWPTKDARQTHGGGHNWSEMTVDEENGIAFVGFGSPRFDFYGGDRKGNNLFANSLVAIDARTGKRRWHFQTIHHDLWDYDIPQSAKLLTITQNGKPRQIVAQGTKQGLLFVFDRLTGQPIWPIEERKVPQTDVPGEWTSPTQPFPTKPEPFARITFTEKDINPYLPKETQEQLRAQLRSYRNEGLYTPPSFEGSIQIPGHNGGANFGTSAVDPIRGEFYVVHKALPTLLKISLPTPTAPRGAGAGPAGGAAGGGGAGRGGGGAAGGGGGRGGGGGIVTPEQKAELMAQAKELVANANGARLEFTSPVNFMNINFGNGSMTAVKPPWSEMVKYDLNTGDVKWRIPLGVQEAPPEYNIPKDTGVQFQRNAPLVTAGGLIFVAVGPERKVHAYDRDNGKELWQFSLPNGSEGMPATYEVNGRQFVVFPVAQPTGNFPASFSAAEGGRGAAPGGGTPGPEPGRPGGPGRGAAAPGAAAPAAAAPGAAPAQAGPGAPDAPGAQGGRAGGGGRQGGRGAGGPQLPSAYIVFALPAK